ncbi:MAG: GNAT family N-acetyltransferase [Synergistaceae bacterium]|nr:GNAT family N-acetyltransferase [Synergistaceae bacterium]
MKMMESTLAERCLAAAANTGAFSGEELAVLEDVLLEWTLHPGRDYILLTEEEGGDLAGFLIFGPTPMTSFAFDLYWIAVDPAFQKKGVGRKLEERMCSALLEQSDRAVIRIETAGRDDYLGQRFFYLARKYGECGRIPDFYREGDDLVLYCKRIGKES